ncbi:MAG: hypothetical protein AAB695_01010 [Patescibacteria group bacterium]
MRPGNIAEIREWYERNRNHGNSKGTLPDFDTMLAKFSDDCTKFNDIAAELGLTRERIRQIYQKYFSSIIARRPNGRTRQKVCTLKRRTVRVNEFFHSDSRYAPLLDRAAREGIEAKPVFTHSAVAKHNKRRFLLNGLICKLLVVSAPREHQERLCFKFSLTSLEEIEFLILQAGVPESKFFVLPITTVWPGKSIYIPAGFRWLEYKNSGRRVKTDWFQYLEAWHLLKNPIA